MSDTVQTQHTSISYILSTVNHPRKEFVLQEFRSPHTDYTDTQFNSEAFDTFNHYSTTFTFHLLTSTPSPLYLIIFFVFNNSLCTLSLSCILNLFLISFSFSFFSIHTSFLSICLLLLIHKSPRSISTVVFSCFLSGD